MLKGKTCIITGANSGIGKVTAVALAKQQARVVMFCRNADKAELARQEIMRQSSSSLVEIIVCDLNSLNSVKIAAETFIQQYDSLDILINNAGLILFNKYISAEGYESTFATNYLGPFLLTHLLLDMLKASALGTRDSVRIVNVSSLGHKMAKFDIDDLMMARKFKNFTAYNNSKLANILFTYKLAKELKDTNITVNALHPGAVYTNFGDNAKFALLSDILFFFVRPFVKTSEQGAKTSIHLALSSELEGVTGTYWDNCKQVASSLETYDEELQDKLWQKSFELVDGF